MHAWQVLTRVEDKYPEFIYKCETLGVKYSAVMAAAQDASKGVGRSWKSFFGRDTRPAVEEVRPAASIVHAHRDRLPRHDASPSPSHHPLPLDATHAPTAIIASCNNLCHHDDNIPHKLAHMCLACVQRMTELGYTWKWLGDDVLKATSPALPAVRKAPGTDRRVFFNQLVAQITNAKEFNQNTGEDMVRLYACAPVLYVMLRTLCTRMPMCTL